MNWNKYAIGDNIRKIRVDRGLSQTELAEAMEVSTKTVFDLENGTRTIHVERIMKLMDILDADFEEIIGVKEFRRFIPSTLMTAKDFAKYCDTTPPTIYSYDRLGFIKSQYINNKKYYDISQKEIVNRIWRNNKEKLILNIRG